MRASWILAVLAAACGDGGGGGGADGGADAMPPPGDVVGRAAILEFHGGMFPAYSSVALSFLDPPAADLVNDGVCRAYPQPCLGNVGACAAPPAYSAGTVTITGLKSSPLVLEPGFMNQYIAQGLPSDLFDGGDPITVTAEGDVVAGFDLAAHGVETLVSPQEGMSLPPLAAGSATFDWTPGTAAGDRVRLYVNVASVCHAGGDWYVLNCDADDADGTLTISTQVLDALPRGYSGCGSQLIRYSNDVVGDNELFVGNAATFDLYMATPP